MLVSNFLLMSMVNIIKTLILRKAEGSRRMGWQRMRWLDKHHQLNGHEFEQNLGDCEGQETWHAAVHGVAELGMT